MVKIKENFKILLEDEGWLDLIGAGLLCANVILWWIVLYAIGVN